MKRLSNEDYKEAVGILERYNYNCLNIVIIPKDIIGIKSTANDGQPKAPYSISDPVFNTILELEDNELLKKSLREYKIVERSKTLLNDKDIDYIFENLFRLKRNKWDIINELHTSEETYKRRKRALIYAVHNEIIKSQ